MRRTHLFGRDRDDDDAHLPIAYVSIREPWATTTRRRHKPSGSRWTTYSTLSPSSSSCVAAPFDSTTISQLTVDFQVEGRLFKLPRRAFESQSQIFCDMFASPQTEGLPADGSSKEHPLRLDGYKLPDFRALLKVMFPT